MPDSQQDVPVARPERHLLGGPDGQGGVLRGVQPRQVHVHGIRRIRNQQRELAIEDKYLDHTVRVHPTECCDSQWRSTVHVN